MYTSYFGFREKPFNVTPNPRFFYTNPSYQEAYANLLYGIHERKGFLVLTGEVGTGKTTILRRLMENLESNLRFVFFYNTTLTFEELLSFICEELGLRFHGEGQLPKIQALNEFLLEQLKKGSTGVLFIDEAQNLSEKVLENLRLLSNLETSTEKLLQIVLAGQPELERKLDQPELRQLKQRIFLQWRLDSLTEEEVGAFIDYRLKAVGYKRNDLFSRDAIRQIAFYSKGIPRLINIICDNALLIAYGASQKKVPADIIKEVARDLRLGSEVRLPVAEAPTSGMPSGNGEYNGRHLAILRRFRRHLGRPGESMDLATAIAPADKLEDEPAPVVKVAPSPARLTTDTVPQSFWDMLTRALTEAMGPMAPLVIRDQLATLGNPSTNLPKASLEKLVELVSREILDDLLKIGFKERMSAAIGTLNSTAVTLSKEVT
jgi:general secretion pathway protein A